MKKTRIMMYLSKRGVPGVHLFGHYNYNRAQPGLRDHEHRDAIEICFLVKGRQTYRVGKRNYQLRGGDIFIAFPNEEHSTGEGPEEKGILYWMVLKRPRKPNSFLGLTHANGSALFRSLLRLNSRHFRGSWKMKKHLDAITASYHQHVSPLQSIMIANDLVAFLIEVTEAAQSSSSRATAEPFQTICYYIEEHIAEPLTIPALAARARLSIPRFKARFKEEYGVPPGEYIIRERIKKACELLAQGQATITEIAYDLGFSSSQYFATVFKRYTGQRPSAYSQSGNRSHVTKKGFPVREKPRRTYVSKSIVR